MHNLLMDKKIFRWIYNLTKLIRNAYKNVYNVRAVNQFHKI